MTIGAGTMTGPRNLQNRAVQASWCLSLALSIATSNSVSAISIGALCGLLAQDPLGALGEIRRAFEQPAEGEIRARYREGQRYPHPEGRIGGRAGIPMALPTSSKIFTIFEGTSEIQRMIIGRAVSGLDVR